MEKTVLFTGSLFLFVYFYRTQNAPVHKEVKVQLLGSGSMEKREFVGRDTRSALREVDSATTIAAATAAAIATTAPLLKVQNDLEAKVNSVSELLQKLQETDRQLQRVSEQQTSMKAQREEPHYHQRVNELEKQMNTFMMQRIQHLEKLQEQQMNIQSHLISSAVNTRGLQQNPVPASGALTRHSERPEQRSLTNEAPLSHRGLFPTTAAPGVHTQKSSLKTPVPRRYAPEPVPKNGRISEKENPVMEKENIPKPMSEGIVKHLSMRVVTSSVSPLRHSALPADSIPAFESYTSIEKTVQKADDLLQDLAQLRREMHKILKVNKPSILQNVKVPKSILTDAARILRGVQNNKKVLEENLEAVTRANDGDAMYSITNSLTTNRDVLEEIRIRRTVDEWIKAITEEIQNCKLLFFFLFVVCQGGPVGGTALVQNEDYLSQVYGKAIYQGHRSTLKKGPYLRFNSPSPKSKIPRPKLIETVRGTKVRSARTQTCSHTQKVISSPRKKHPVYALAQENRYLFSPSRDAPAASGPLEGHLIPMAIPLGQTQSSSTLLQPAGVVTDKPHPVTVTTSFPQVPPKPPVEVKKPNIAVIEMRSEKKDPPQLSVQVLPNVDIDSVSSASVSVNHVPSGSEPLLPPADAVIQEEERDEIPEFLEPLLELNGQFKVAEPQYNGPLFPPVASAPQQSADILDELIQRRETIENRLINWVEQEIMAKIISEMCPARKETVPSISSSESEDNEVVTPDIVEVAGGGGFQLFVNAGVPVDSEMINHFVNEALSETIATMLGDNQAQRTVPDPNVIPRVEIAAAPGRVGTPVVTPVSTPPPGATPSPPASEWGSQAAKTESPKSPNPWDGAELPLEEEKPSPITEEPFCPRPVEMSVANDEEPEALVLPSQQLPVRPIEPLPCSLQVPSPVPTLSSGVSTQESSLTPTETETTDRPISEGELLFTYGQPLPAGGNHVGELSEGQRPRLSRAQERIMMGNSIFMDHPAAQSSGNRSHQDLRSASPGQVTQIRGTVRLLILLSSYIPLMTWKLIFFPDGELRHTHNGLYEAGISSCGKARKFISSQLKIVLKPVVCPSSPLFFVPVSLLLSENVLLYLFNVSAASMKKLFIFVDCCFKYV
uniref:KIAA0586 n=1 Tax=Malurus cyaneus samueli TaxID=2593467 RepID=A0A8C5X464_9PASS